MMGPASWAIWPTVTGPRLTHDGNNVIIIPSCHIFCLLGSRCFGNHCVFPAIAGLDFTVVLPRCVSRDKKCFPGLLALVRTGFIQQNFKVIYLVVQISSRISILHQKPYVSRVGWIIKLSVKNRLPTVSNFVTCTSFLFAEFDHYCAFLISSNLTFPSSH